MEEKFIETVRNLIGTLHSKTQIFVYVFAINTTVLLWVYASGFNQIIPERVIWIRYWYFVIILGISLVLTLFVFTKALLKKLDLATSLVLDFKNVTVLFIVLFLSISAYSWWEDFSNNALMCNFKIAPNQTIVTVYKNLDRSQDKAYLVNAKNQEDPEQTNRQALKAMLNGYPPTILLTSKTILRIEGHTDAPINNNRMYRVVLQTNPFLTWFATDEQRGWVSSASFDDETETSPICKGLPILP